MILRTAMGEVKYSYFYLVKKAGLHRTNTIAWILLSSALLFNQVGLNFFHDRHEAHEFYDASKKHQAMLLSHGEHCQVCSLEVLFHIILPASTEVPTQIFATEYNEQVSPQTAFIFFDRANGRGPPFAA